MRKVLAQTFLIQGAGVALMLAVTLFISRLGGPDAQGGFALVKSATDLLVGLCSLGLPSAIVYLLNRTASGHAAVYRHCRRYGNFLALLLPVPVFAAVYFSGIEANTSAAIVRSLAIALAAAWLTQFALLRAVLLVFRDGPIFSALSILQWVVIALVVMPLLNSNPYVFEIAYCAAGAVSLLAIILYLRRFGLVGIAASQQDTSAINWPILRQQSGHVLAQTALLGLQPFLTNALLAQYDPSLIDAGLFNVASMVITLPNLLVALVAPVLFNRWSKSLDWEGISVLARNALWIGLAGQAIALLALPLVGTLLGFIFGASFLAATLATQIMLLATLAVITGRILTPALQGLGLTHVATLSCVCRLVIGLLTVVVTLNYLMAPPIVAMAIAWCLGEYAAFAVLIMRVKFARAV